jgi:hypothetical protein
MFQFFHSKKPPPGRSGDGFPLATRDHQKVTVMVTASG